ncbi:beta-1,4-galactosyltransferase 3-like isoform X2 [Lepus europaeus]|uniref:beta-1,4-galactosyltransferase 3-like isoform X2 n=1 Tax=Lepus europaeus TaxID=9983 RepID=UPI002B4A1839|nr:beta-1,4-galactosyltransferase 3-like isoform X2 [Lepus europaeus]
MKSRVKPRRGLLLLFLGVQLLLVGAFLYQVHRCRGVGSFLRLLTQARPQAAGQLPSLAPFSSPGVPHHDVYANLSQIRPLNVSQDELPNCPEVSPYVSGPLKVTIPENLTLEVLVRRNPLVEPGGQYWPPDCWPRHHTAVVVPYHGQARHLLHLLFHLHPFLQRQQLHYAIYVVDPVNNTAFSRGRLRNVGFWEALQDGDWDCVFLHAVNLLPEDDRNLYTCDLFPAHVSVAIDKFNYRLPYQGYLGGVFALRPIHFLRINGFPNTHWGLDDEDSDIAARVKLSGLLLSRPHLLFGRYHMLEGQDAGPARGVQRPGLLARIRQGWQQDGLSSLGYRLLAKERQPLYTRFTVDVGFRAPGAPVPG